MSQRNTLGTPVTWTHDGQTFTLKPWDFALEGEFAAWVAARSRRRIKSRRKDSGEEEYQREMRDLRRDEDAGLYEWASEIVHRAWQRGEGMVYLAWLTLKQSSPHVPIEWVAKLPAQVLSDLFNEVLVPLNFPTAPVTTAASAPGDN